MDDLTKKKIVDLYNDAVLKIFPTGTMVAIFGEEIESSIGHWKMMFPPNGMDNYNQCTNRRTLDEVCNPIFEQKQIFLDFIQENFKELDNVEKLRDIEKKVKDFIQKMEVKSDTTNPYIKIDVTLHDIIGNFSTTSRDSLHCQSEKLFLAILFAIKKKVHVFELTKNYNLTFKFAKSSIGKSGLQKSSVICSGDKTITESMDPVDPAKNFFGLELLILNKAIQDKNVASIKKSLAEAKAAAEAKTAAEAKAAAEAERAAAEAERAAADAKAAAEAPPAPAVEIPDVKAAAIEELPKVEGESPQTLPALEPQPTPLTGDGLFEKYRESTSINAKDKDADFENYRKSVVQKFKSEESYYDSEFSELPSQGKNPTDYQLAIVKSVINKNKNLFDKLMELLSLTSSEDLYKKLIFIHSIFIRCQFSDTSCSKIETIILCLTASTFIQVGGHKSRRRRTYRRHARKTRRGRKSKSKSKSKSKPKTHRRRHHSRTRKHHKKYISRRR